MGVREDCNPNPDCTDHVMGDKVEDPTNCTNFYVCFGDGIVADQPSECEDGDMFDATAGQCATMSDPPCEPSCAGGGGSGNCHLLCDASLDFVSHHSDCGKYLVCVPGGTEELDCPPEHPFFDGESCGNDESLCCVPGCNPTCEAANTLIPDPNDCQRYYFCEAVGEPDENYHFTCADNGNFNVHLGECSTEAPCTLLCPPEP